MAIEIIEKNAEQKFNELLQVKDKDIIVDFFASWCGPCKMLSPVLEAVADEKPDTLEVYKINIDDHPEFAIQKSVMSVPTVMFIKNGEVKSTEVGFMSKDEILDHLD
ncbi:MAG: thioredoxin [Bacillota bacterium]|jgi:thioredoxin 1